MIEKAVLERALQEGLALTFADVSVQTAHSSVLPLDVNVETKFSTNVGLKIPIVSAAMDTVTDHRLAIALAKEGGIGVIHKGFDPEQHAREVALVKHHLNGLIEQPKCVRETETIAQIVTRREERGYSFHSFPVLDTENKLVGILTGNDFGFCSDYSLQAGQVMTANPLTAPAGTSIEQAYKIMRDGKKKVLPLVNNEGKVVGLYTFSDVKRITTGDAASYNLDNRQRLRVAAAIGVGESELERLALLAKENVDVVVIDTAHGHTVRVIETLTAIKDDGRFSNIDVVAGNVSLGASAKALVDAGADGIRVGQGPGSICTTRQVAGVGRPQLSAVYDCARTIQSAVPINADGGLTEPGDIVKAIAAGAHSVTLGSMLAGTTEAPGDIVYAEGRTWKEYRGMGSPSAMRESRASRERYGQGAVDPAKVVPEGVEGRVPHKGTLKDVIHDYVGGLRSGMGYTGAPNIEALRDKAQFDRVTDAGRTEARPHDVHITREGPRYGGENS